MVTKSSYVLKSYSSPSTLIQQEQVDCACQQRGPIMTLKLEASKKTKVLSLPTYRLKSKAAPLHQHANTLLHIFPYQTSEQVSSVCMKQLRRYGNTLQYPVPAFQLSFPLPPAACPHHSAQGLFVVGCGIFLTLGKHCNAMSINCPSITLYTHFP